MEEEKEFPDHINNLSEDHSVKTKILRVEGELKKLVKENPDLNITWNDEKKEFEFFCSSLSNKPVRLSIDYSYNRDFDKHFLLRSIVNLSFSLGYEQCGNDMTNKFKQLFEL